jgi:DNA mismatch endonuclease (patch repair protein)
MQANRGRDTSIELRLRSLLHQQGLRYAIDKRPLAGVNRRADVVFSSARVAVFVHGCFWHGCRWHGSRPKTNVEFWAKKIERNRERDRETRRLLRRSGWLVVTYWEHQDLDQKAPELIKLVKNRRKKLARA